MVNYIGASIVKRDIQRFSGRRFNSHVKLTTLASAFYIPKTNTSRQCYTKHNPKISIVKPKNITHSIFLFNSYFGFQNTNLRMHIPNVSFISD